MKNRTLIFLIFFGLISAAYSQANKVSRKELESYLGRSINMQGMWSQVEDTTIYHADLRFLSRIQPAFIGRVAGVWEGGWDEHRIFANAAIAANDLRKDPALKNTILQAAILEAVSPYIDIVDTNYSDGNTNNLSGMRIPLYVQKAFDIPLDLSMRFSFRSMVYDSVYSSYDPELIRQGAYKKMPGYPAAPFDNSETFDMSKVQSKMLFYYRATRFIDLGYEAIHFGQVNIMDLKDPMHIHWWELLSKVRQYAAVHARRGFVLCDAHTLGKFYDGEGKEKGQLLFDFHSYPIRMQEIKSKGGPNYDCRISAKPASSDIIPIYRRSKGGISPMGWLCNNLPYMVEFDNTGPPLPTTGKESGAQYVWGWDEISWFANPGKSEEFRNKWLIYAWKKIRKIDPNGFLEFSGRNVYFVENGGKVKTYTAYPHQEATISYIWNKLKE